jgi:hypothetical protein
MKVQRLQRKLLEPLRNIKGTLSGAYVFVLFSTTKEAEIVVERAKFRGSTTNMAVIVFEAEQSLI